jgi:hypothetical protein
MNAGSGVHGGASLLESGAGFNGSERRSVVVGRLDGATPGVVGAA